ncbi:hypothetical protein Hanom_Chr03g00251431 [Helianthus anomalus]
MWKLFSLVNLLVLLKEYLFFHFGFLFTAMTTGLASKPGYVSSDILSDTVEAAKKPSLSESDMEDEEDEEMQSVDGDEGGDSGSDIEAIGEDNQGSELLQAYQN